MSPSKPRSSAASIPVYLGLGSNLGDREAHLRAALAALRERAGAFVFAVSGVYATAPVGMGSAPEFLNAAVGLTTSLDPDALLAACLEIEAARGRRRRRGEGWSPRTLDLDLLAYGGIVRSDPGLVLPHPRLTERAFVVVPLAEIAPELPVRGRSVAVWAAGIDRSGVRRTEIVL